MASVDPRYHDPVLGVVFDLDGTLVLSDHPFERMRREVIRIAESAGVPPGRLSLTQTIPTLMELAGSELAQRGSSEGVRFRFEADVNRRIDAIEMESLPQTVQRPGALELVRDLIARGFRLGVLTRSSARFAEAALRRTGLREYLPTVRSRSDSGPVKPDPEALLLLLQAMEVPRDRAIYVGDHRLDADCASRARVRFYALLPEHAADLRTEGERFRAAGATAIAANLDELRRQLGLDAARTV